MLLGRVLTSSWQEAIGLLTESRIRGVEVILPADLQMRLEDPAGQQFILRIVGAAGIGVNGNIVVLNAGLQINCHEAMP